MLVEPPSQLEWLEPWQRIEACGDALVRELQKEVPPQHLLYGIPVIAVARRIDCDDVLFATGSPKKPLAVVHLTWTSCTETDPQWPFSTLYESWQDWIKHCLLPDHEEYSGNG
jgi:hypothetical protein